MRLVYTQISPGHFLTILYNVHQQPPQDTRHERALHIPMYVLQYGSPFILVDPVSPLLRFSKVQGSKPAPETDYPKFISLFFQVFQSNDIIVSQSIPSVLPLQSLRIIIATHDGKGKGQISTHHVGMRKERGTAPDILNLGTRRRRVVTCTSRPFYPL